MENLSARIFLNELHGNSFFQMENDAFCALELFSNQVLEPGASKSFDGRQENCIVILPITGDLVYKGIGVGADVEVNVGQAFFIKKNCSFQFSIENPFLDEQVNFLLLKFADTAVDEPLEELIDFDLCISDNKLNKIIPAQVLPFKLGIGQFAGREEVVFPLHNSGIFCYVLSGAFEVQGRLLHANDGLALWNVPKIEAEALSNNAILLTVELPYI
ncbi:MAG: hypothetical protein V4687_17985 [Bacteroidota bacterium]